MKQIANREENRSGRWAGRRAAWLTGLAVAVFAIVMGSFGLRANAVLADDGAGAGPMGAARLSSVEGQVRLMQDGQVIADSAPVNAPLFAGARIETGDDGKAEVQFDDGSVARISPNSALTIQSVAGVGNAGTDLSVDHGLIYFELQSQAQDGSTRVLFGDSVATVSGFTVLRVRMDTPPGDLAVFSGNAHLDRGNLSVDLRGGESIALDASDPNRYNVVNSIDPDSWDAWNSDRDQALSTAASDQTAAPGNFENSDNPNAAWNDLDANGNWYDVPGQGYIWSPFMAASAGWDPYGCGHWMWTPQFGYIWVSCESWGYLPFSCGAWNFYNGFGWGWSPGMGGCVPWWRRGGYGGWNIGNGPSGYHTIPRPILRQPRAREPIPIIPVNRYSNNGPSEFPQRGRNNPVIISGQQVEPLHRLPAQGSYVRSTSGFVYHPSGGYQGGRDGGVVDRKGSGQAGNGQPVLTNRPNYQRNQTGDSYVRQANPGQGRSYTPPAQGDNGDRNNNPPTTVITQPGRVVVPPGQYRGEPGRTVTPPPQQQQPQPQPQPQPSRQYTPPPQQQQPNRQYTPPPQSQPRPEPVRPYSPPPSQRNPGGGGSFVRPSSGGGAPAPSGGGVRGGGPVRH